MKHLRFTLPVVLLSLATMAFTQSEAHQSSAAPVSSDAQKSFATIKSLAGDWEGPVTVPEMPAMSGHYARFPACDLEGERARS